MGRENEYGKRLRKIDMVMGTKMGTEMGTLDNEIFWARGYLFWRNTRRGYHFCKKKYKIGPIN